MRPRSRSLRAFKLYWALMRATAPVSRRLSGLAANHLWFTPWEAPLSESARAKQAAWLAPTTSRRFVTRHGNLAGFDAGEGQTILLVHGWADTSASMGAFIEPLVQSGFRVVGIDLPSHGGSPRIEPNIYVASEAIADVIDSTRAVGVIAHSLGGLATTLALPKVSSVRQAVLIDPSSNLDHILERFAALLRMPPRAEAGLRRLLESKFGPEVWSEISVPKVTEGVQVPALIVHDEDDEQVPYEDSVTLAASWPGAELHTTHGLGHTRGLRDPKVIELAVTRMVESLAGRVQ